VVDSLNTVVGPAVAFDLLNPIVALRIDGAIVMLRLLAGNFYGYDAAWFAGPGCTGQAYVNQLPAMALPNTAVDHVGRVFVDVGQPPAAVVISSVADPSGCYDIVQTMVLVPANQVLDLPSRFVAPFRVQ
jgi:hypothetical protein